VRRTARALEIAAFRTLYLGRGLEGLAAAIEVAEREVGEKRRRGRAVQRLRVEDWQAVYALVQALREAFEPLTALFETRAPHALSELVAAHVKAAEAIAQLPEGDKAAGLWAEVAGEAASLFTTSLLDESLPPLSLAARAAHDALTGERVSSLSEQLPLAVAAARLHLENLLIPLNLHAGYVYTAPDLTAWLLVGASAAGVAALLVWSWRRAEAPILIGLSWALLAYAPYSNLLPVGRYTGDSYLYLALAGAALALVGLLGYSFLEGSAKARMANWATNLAALCVFVPQGAVLMQGDLAPCPHAFFRAHPSAAPSRQPSAHGSAWKAWAQYSSADASAAVTALNSTWRVPDDPQETGDGQVLFWCQWPLPARPRVWPSAHPPF
jgi:hypothetical protein